MLPAIQPCALASPIPPPPEVRAVIEPGEAGSGSVAVRAARLLPAIIPYDKRDFR